MMSTTPAATEGAANNEVELNDLDRLDNINPNETMLPPEDHDSETKFTMSYYKRPSHKERCGHVFLVIVTSLCLLSLLAASGLLAWYIVMVREADGISYNVTSFEVTTADDITTILLLRNVTDAEVSLVAQALWDADDYRLPPDMFELNLQNQVATSNPTQSKRNLIENSEDQDIAPENLFGELEVDLVTWSSTYLKLINLMNNFNVESKEQDLLDPYKQAKVDNLLKALSQTQVMKKLDEFLVEKGFYENSTNALTDVLYDLWFVPYTSSLKHNVTDTSGFEHVFLGETKRKKAIGMHSWVRAYEAEKMGEWDYEGYIKYREPYLITVQFSLYGRSKPQSSMFVGTSPEFDFAIYTLCFLTRINQDCNVELGGEMVKIRTSDAPHVPGLQILTAHPVLS